MNKLVKWFIENYPEHYKKMSECSHSVEGHINTYHMEGSIFTHTMMVCMRAENDDIVNKVCALLHDIGKPYVVEDRGDKRSFIGHEGVSFYLSIEIVNHLLRERMINEQEREEILFIISKHGMLFDYITEDGKMRKPERVFSMFKDVELYKKFIKQVKNDSTGRFNEDKNVAFELGEALYSEKDYEHTSDKSVKTATLKLMVGIPGSGKTTWLKNNSMGSVIISRDDTLVTFGKEKYGNELSYSEIWKHLTKEDHKEIDGIIQKQFRNAVKQNLDIIIDMTNVSPKSRRKWYMKNYFKEAVVLATDYEEIHKRLLKRGEEKVIPEEVVLGMAKNFTIPDYSEVDKITWVFD